MLPNDTAKPILEASNNNTRHRFPRRPCLFPSGSRCVMGNQWQDVALICEPDAKNPPSAPNKFTGMTRVAISIMVACLLVVAVALPILHFREVGLWWKPPFPSFILYPLGIYCPPQCFGEVQFWDIRFKACRFCLGKLGICRMWKCGENAFILKKWVCFGSVRACFGGFGCVSFGYVNFLNVLFVRLYVWFGSACALTFISSLFTCIVWVCLPVGVCALWVGLYVEGIWTYYEILA